MGLIGPNAPRPKQDEKPCGCRDGCRFNEGEYKGKVSCSGLFLWVVSLDVPRQRCSLHQDYPRQEQHVA